METILEGMPDTVLRAKGIVPTTEGPHELQYGTHYCSLTPTESTDYSLVVIGTDFNVPMVHNEVCNMIPVYIVPASLVLAKAPSLTNNYNTEKN